MPQYPGFLGPSNRGQSYMADDEVLRNWYLERNESPSAPNPWAMVPCPGFAAFASVSQAPTRGGFYQDGRAFFVAGAAFYELFTDGTTTLRGTVANDVLPVTIHANGDAGDQLWIASGGIGYVYDLTANTLAVDGNAGTTVSMGSFLSARFLYLDATTGAFYASAQYDGTTWDPTMVAQSQSSDPWRALIVTPDGLIHLLGEFSGEVWADQGTFPFPFSKIQEASSPYGIVGPWAWALDTQLTWIAQNQQGSATAVRAQGYDPQRISTHALETSMQGYADLSDVSGFAYQEHGHSFTVFTFPDPDVTWCYDQASQFWHDRSYWDVTTASFMAYRPGWMIQAFGKILVGDRLTGGVYEMDSSFFTDVDGSAIRRVRTAPRFSVEQKRVTLHSLQVVMDVGQGLNTGQGIDPQLMMRMSKNGGQSFGTERWSSAGQIGSWGTRVFWTGMGQARNFVPQFVATDPVPYRIVDCLIDYTVGTS